MPIHFPINICVYLLAEIIITSYLAHPFPRRQLPGRIRKRRVHVRALGGQVGIGDILAACQDGALTIAVYKADAER